MFLFFDFGLQRYKKLGVFSFISYLIKQKAQKVGGTFWARHGVLNT
jgi:hypothetical protein